AFGKPIQDLEGTAHKAMLDTNEALMVLGRTSDTWALQMTPQEQPRALSVEPDLYSLTANDAFMKGGIDIRARFHLVTPLSAQTIAWLKKGGHSSQDLMEYVNQVKDREPALWSTNSNAPAVSAREIGQLLDEGYWFGLYPKDPKNPTEMVQMMFPRALQPSV